MEMLNATNHLNKRRMRKNIKKKNIAVLKKQRKNIWKDYIKDIKRIILDLKKENSELKNSNQTIKEKVKKLSELNTNLETSYSGLKKKFSSLDPTKLETYKVLLMRKRINEHPERSLSDLAALDTPLY